VRVEAVDVRVLSFGKDENLCTRVWSEKAIGRGAPVEVGRPRQRIGWAGGRRPTGPS
jgi:hypothetical protein